MEKQTAERNQLREFAPKFAELNDDVLFGKMWAREDKLSTKNRCMITIAGLIGKGMLDNSFKYHLMNAKKHGILCRRRRMVSRRRKTSTKPKRRRYGVRKLLMKSIKNYQNK